ncbi:TAXI family TRAP transporter solute-binding subunit [Paracoccus fistulariae]|uniref:TAXI family TRAP transporter solute-binding subunit n=1 Tax=Paracoccus fistulariae TaxID=658446 RepID=A0ABY7SJ97_9RHOB|nr:TAXI family TRAP transporter solute-binding subunit [Paracoccus fistulariae]MDB6180707.1 TAXI family TRAP transporter solute-binding subunit [Paracoccus fistulariae]WCR07064.1 TAXI family TRAP transporter solute-binding subunit [Paracoccus fistulariae]
MNKRFILGLAAAIGIFAQGAAAQDMAFFRIGTGGTAGTYYPIGGLIANAISNPPGSRACEDGGSCGVPGLVATAVASNGSVGNINAINGGQMEAGFTQSDVAYWAQTGTGLWSEQPPVEKLRLISNLYPESIHLVARADAGIETVSDLAGKKVSLDEPGSGTLVDAKLILEAYGLSEDDISAEYLKPDQAADRMRDGAMDAFFFVGGYPAGAIAELASQHDVKLIPITGAEAEKLLGEYTFFAADNFPAGTYEGQDGEVPTISVGAQFVTSADQPEELVYEITKALYNENTQKLFAAGHAKGKLITLDSATDGAGIPFHPGAEKYYREAGMIE